jgi:hypothetical protein
MEKEEDYIDQLCHLINRHWDDLTLDQQSEIENANKSMKFFIDLEEFERVEYEIRRMYSTFNNIEKWT